jgi:hypothetical protein
MLQALPLSGRESDRALLQQEIKQCWRIASRYDNLDANYLTFVKRPSIRSWLRAYESTPVIGGNV